MINLWPTEVFQFSVPDFENFNKTMYEVIINECDNSTTKNGLSMKGPTGWHGPDDYASRDSEWSIYLHNFIKESCRHYLNNLGIDVTNSQDKISCWPMVAESGDYSIVHNHPSADVSGVYYIHSPNNLPDDQGNLVFIDPRTAARATRFYCNNNIIVKPIPGQGLIFPGWLEHYVESHYTEDKRISLAFNYAID
jgi:uncharacterized protein (TIGR02466 family)